MKCGRSLFYQAVLIPGKVYLPGCAHLVNPAVFVTRRQVIADRVELVELLQVAVVSGDALQNLVHAGGGGVSYPEALREAVLLLPASARCVGVSQVQVIGQNVLQ